MQGTITFVSGKGWYFCESDADHTAVFIHAKFVDGRRCLKVDDRVSFDLVPCERKPDSVEGINVKYLGHTIARQVSGEGVRP
jgi:cold shock CspA family protein